MGIRLDFILRFGILMVFCGLAPKAIAAEYLLPVDESTQDLSFAQFKNTLRSALQKKDALFIKNILANDVEYSFGANPEHDKAIDGFLEHYKIQNETSSPFWNDLNEILELGCTKSDKNFICPYVYSMWPEKLDSFSFVVAIKKKTPIYMKPDISMKPIKHVDFEILKLSYESKNEDWLRIDLGNKQTGFVLKTDVRSPVDFRSEFQKSSSGWKLKYFVAGD